MPKWWEKAIDALTNLRRKLYMRYSMALFRWGLKHGKICMYGEGLVERLREVYWGGLPGSILLLSRQMCEGFCYDRTQLMARAFLELPGEIRIITASVESLRVLQSPWKRLPGDDLHCVLEWREPDAGVWIIDTGIGVLIQRWLFWLMFFPRKAQVLEREKFEKLDALIREEDFAPEDVDLYKYWAPMFLPIVEECFAKPLELYGDPENGRLKQEVELFKEKIDYERVKAAVEYDVAHMREPGFTPTMV